MPKIPQITYDELLAELGVATGPCEGWHTKRELAEIWDRGERTLSSILQKIHAAGRLEVRRDKRPSIDGRLMTVPVYRIRAAVKKRSA